MKGDNSDKLPTLSLSQYIQQHKAVSSIVNRSNHQSHGAKDHQRNEKEFGVQDDEVFLSTGSTRLDRLINDELESRSLYAKKDLVDSRGTENVPLPPGILCSNSIFEVSGPSGSGKTIMGIMMSVDYLFKAKSSKKVLWISTNSKPFPKSRFEEILQARLISMNPGLDVQGISVLYKGYLARIVHMNVDSVSELVLLFSHSLSLLYSKIDINKFGFVVIDTLSTLVSLVALGIQLNPPYFKIPDHEIGSDNHNTTPNKNNYGTKDLISRRNKILTNLLLNITKFNLINNSTVLLLSDMICKRDKLLDQPQQQRYKYADMTDSQPRGRYYFGASQNDDHSDQVNFRHSQTAYTSDPLLPSASVTLFPELGHGFWSNFIDARLILFRDSRENSIILNPSMGNYGDDTLDSISVPYSQNQLDPSQSAFSFLESENLEEDEYLGRIFDSTKFIENQGIPHAMINRSPPTTTHVKREGSQGLAVVNYAKMIRSVKKGELVSLPKDTNILGENGTIFPDASTNNCLILLEEINQFLAKANFLPLIVANQRLQLTIRGLLETIAIKTGYYSFIEQEEDHVRALPGRRYVCIFGITKWRGICDCNLPNYEDEVEENGVKADYDYGIQEELASEESTPEVMEESVMDSRKRVEEDEGSDLEEREAKRQKFEETSVDETPVDNANISSELAPEGSIVDNNSNNVLSTSEIPNSYLKAEKVEAMGTVVTDPLDMELATGLITESEITVATSKISQTTFIDIVRPSEVTNSVLNNIQSILNESEDRKEIIENITEIIESVPLINGTISEADSEFSSQSTKVNEVDNPETSSFSDII